MSPLVEVRDLKTFFSVRSGFFRASEVRAVDGVTLEIGRGETLALVGESGSGKTTLGKTILRLVEPAAGGITFDGEDILEYDSRELKAYRGRSQVIFQDPYSSISPYMSVQQIIEEPLHVHAVGTRRERTEKVIDALELVKLSPAAEIAAKFPHSLSGGQRQRVCIARSLVLQPEFIVADEPVSMVDASSRSEILRLLRDLQERHSISFLYITHDIASARHFSDRVAVMYLGTIAEMGESADLIARPLHPYTRGLLEAVPEPDPENRNRLRPVIPGEPPSAIDVPRGCPFNPRCANAIPGTCDSRRPEFLEVKPGRLVACHLYPGTPNPHRQTLEN